MPQARWQIVFEFSRHNTQNILIIILALYGRVPLHNVKPPSHDVGLVSGFNNFDVKLV